MAVREVEAFAKLARREVCLNRVVGLCRGLAGEVAAKILMTLYIGPMNGTQLLAATGLRQPVVSCPLKRLVMLGLVESERRGRYHVHGVTGRGRRLLEAVIEATGEESPPGGPAGPKRMKLVDGRRGPVDS